MPYYSPRSAALLVSVCALACATAPPRESADDAGSAKIATVARFRAALQDEDLESAYALLGDDPRIWYGEHEGAGSPWKPGGGGRWHDWDAHFRGRTEPASEWHAEGDRVWVDMFETNDYFRLTERGGGYWRGTWFFDDAGRITGFMVSSAPDRATERGRREEFESWAFANHPEEAEYLMPGGSIDPTGDRAPRMRALLEEWRAAVGLEPVD